MFYPLSFALLAASITASALPGKRFIQDTDADIVYSEGSTWHHVNVLDLSNTTYTWSAASNASYAFNFTGNGFALYGNRKANGGYFDVTVDGQAQGHGSGENTYTEDDDLDSSELYRLSNLDTSSHLVQVKQQPIEQSTDLNTTVPFLFLDYVEIEYSINTGIILEPAKSAQANESESARPSAGIIAGTVFGAVVFLLISVIACIGCRRRKVYAGPLIDVESVDRKSEDSECKSEMPAVPEMSYHRPSSSFSDSSRIDRPPSYASYNIARKPVPLE